MPWGAIGGSIAGSAIGGAFNAREAAKNRKFQERMSRTQYQRAADDLEKAGLNRILALGSPAASPSGAQGAMEAPDIAGSGIAASTAKQAIAQGKAQENLIKAQTAETLERTRLTSAEAGKAELTKGLHDALGPAATKVFEAVGNAVNDWVDNRGGPGVRIGQIRDVTDRAATSARSLPSRIWNAVGPPRAKRWWDRLTEWDRNRRESRK